jgi:adenosylmethionine-8-amino-7-oxononanoate aminotransferase
VSAEFIEAFLQYEGVDKTFYHGHTYTGYALGSAIALASLDLIEEKSFMSHCQDIEKMLEVEMPKFEQEIPSCSVRMMGTVGIVETQLKGDRPLLSYYKKMLQNGYYLRPLDNLAYFWPPLCITLLQYQEMLDCSKQCLKEVHQDNS